MNLSAQRLREQFRGGVCFSIRFPDLIQTYFTARQLVALTTFSDLVGEARDKVAGGCAARSCRRRYASPRRRLRRNGLRRCRGDVFGVCVVSRSLPTSSTCFWDGGDPAMEARRDTFARQALPMTWDFAEANLFCDVSR